MELWPEVEYTDEEVAQEYEEFYDDVHSEFIQFGELVNFKVCRNGSPHLRGNVYVHYASQESAMLAYNHMNGRFYAKKQISCEFVGVKKWKIAICGEFMRTNYKTCSHGSACNFMHCFENPRREYEWADLDRPPPRFWQRKMAKLFGHAYISDEDFDEKQEKVRSHRESTYSNHMVRHRGDSVSTYDDDRRKDRHMKESVREDEHRRRSDGREQKYCEDETKDRISRESKYDDRRRVKHSRDNNHDTLRREKDFRDSTHHDDSARDKSASRSMDDDDDDANDDERYFQGHKKFERWSPGRHGETDGREAVYSKDQRRGHKGASYDYEDIDIGDARHVARNSITSDAAYHSHSRSHSHHSERHRSRRRSRSPDGHKSRRSRSRDRSMSHSARGEDGYYSVGEHQHRYSKTIRDNERSSKESKQHRQRSSTQSSNDAFGNQEASQTLEGRVDEDVNRHRKRHSSQDRRKYSESEHDQSLTTQESDHTRIRHSKDLVGTIAAPTTDEDTSGNLSNLERQSGLEVGIDVASQNQETDGSSSSDTVTGLSLVLTTDDVQKSTSQWQSWRKAKAKKAKLGMKDHPPRLVI
uniref:C3H1-type domain-containing protein n=1 Tax=Physcomitrium patens TaxID=3218 RepID=A0A7I4DBG2_PHYPA